MTDHFRTWKVGFTLLELIIVIIIVGVLSGMALPKMFRTVAKADTAEAMNIFSTVRIHMIICAELNGGQFWDDAPFHNCGNWNSLPMDDPSPESSKFTYFFPGTGRDWFLLGARSKEPPFADFIYFHQTPAGVERWGTGKYQGKY